MPDTKQDLEIESDKAFKISKEEFESLKKGYVCDISGMVFSSREEEKEFKQWFDKFNKLPSQLKNALIREEVAKIQEEERPANKMKRLREQMKNKKSGK